MFKGNLRLKRAARRYLIEQMGGVQKAFRILDKYEPELVNTLVELRKIVLPGQTKTTIESAKNRKEMRIPEKYKELIITAVEVATGRGQRGITHARKAIRAGATPKEVQETLALCIYLVGISSWVDGGVECLLAAENERKKMGYGRKFSWTNEVAANVRKRKKP